MVTRPGWLQVADSALVLISTVGITFAIFGRCHRNAMVDIALRCLMAAVSFFAMFHPSMQVSATVAAVLLIAIALGIWQHRRIAPPKTFAAQETAGPGTGDLAPVLAEAKREIG